MKVDRLANKHPLDKMSGPARRWLAEGGNRADFDPNSLIISKSLYSFGVELRRNWDNLDRRQRMLGVLFLVGGASLFLTACAGALDNENGLSDGTIVTPIYTDDSPESSVIVLPTPEVKITQPATPTAEIPQKTPTQVIPGNMDTTFLAVPGVPEGFGGVGELIPFKNTQQIQDKLNERGYAPIVDQDGNLSQTQIHENTKVCIANLPEKLVNPDLPGGEEVRIGSQMGVVTFGEQETGHAHTEAISATTLKGLPEGWSCVNGVVTDGENPSGLGAIKMLLIDGEGNIQGEMPAAYSSDDDVELRWENEGPRLYVNGEPEEFLLTDEAKVVMEPEATSEKGYPWVYAFSGNYEDQDVQVIFKIHESIYERDNKPLRGFAEGEKTFEEVGKVFAAAIADLKQSDGSYRVDINMELGSGEYDWTKLQYDPTKKGGGNISRQFDPNVPIEFKFYDAGVGYDGYVFPQGDKGAEITRGWGVDPTTGGLKIYYSNVAYRLEDLSWVDDGIWEALSIMIHSRFGNTVLSPMDEVLYNLWVTDETKAPEVLIPLSD